LIVTQKVAQNLPLLRQSLLIKKFLLNQMRNNHKKSYLLKSRPNE
jgi:hypothetical protein